MRRTKRWSLSGMVAAMVMAGAAPALAQTISPAKEAAIRELLELTDATQHEVDYGRDVSTQLIAILKRNLPPTENAEEVGRMLAAELLRRLNSDELIARLIPVYDKAFSEAEIHSINQFYESPAGRRLRELMPSIRENSTEVTESWIKELVPDIMNRIRP